jgi:hypothetical protein
MCRVTPYSTHGVEVGEAERALMRNIHPWLPSFGAEFTAAVPLTRIRDIAHRNDIPGDLKNEIKHTIQAVTNQEFNARYVIHHGVYGCTVVF